MSMKKLTLTIIIVVFLSGIISVYGMVFMMHKISDVSMSYEELIDQPVKNHEYMLKIVKNMYGMQAALATYVTSDSDEYEWVQEKIDAISEETETLFEELDGNLKVAEEKELLHQAQSDYMSYTGESGIVFNLFRQGSKMAASYYVTNNLNNCLVRVNDSLDQLNDSIEQNVKQEQEQLQKQIDYVNKQKNICVAVIVCSIAACVFIVLFSGRKILVRHSNEEREHHEHITGLQYDIIFSMANLIESRDGETGEHVKRTSHYVSIIANALKEKGTHKELTEQYVDYLWRAAPLHDIGKIKISDSILQKPGKLTDREYDIMKTHTTQGCKVIEDTMSKIEEKEYLEILRNIALYHHEKWNGSGYPEGLKEKEIPLCARIMAVADVFDALTQERCYKKAMSVEDAYAIIEKDSGSHFDPEIVEIFVQLRPQIEEYLKKDA